MNTYRSFSTCQDADADSRQTTSPHISFAHPSKLVSRPRWFDISDVSYGPLAEAALSPAKYALFMTCGSKLLDTLGFTDPSTTVAFSAKVGFVGGLVLTLLYLALLFTRGNTFRESENGVETLKTYLSLLVQEMLCGAVAAIVGCLASANSVHDQSQMSQLALSAILGPPSFLAAAFGLLGVSMAVYWTTERVRDWYSGY